MTKTRRKVFFWIAVVAFLIITPLIIGYAQGYRFDFQRQEITRVGAILVDSKPKKADIWVNSKKIDNRTSATIKSLLPFRSYNIKIAKEGFIPWEKQLEVEPEKITVAKNIILFPTRLDLKGFANDNLESFSISPDEEKIFGLRSDKQLFIKDTSSFSSDTIAFLDGIRTLGIDNIVWSENNERIIFSRQARGGSLWYALETDENKLTNITNLYEDKLFFISPTTQPLPRRLNTQKIAFLDDSGEKLITLVANNVLIIDIKEESLSHTTLENAKDITIHNKNIFILKNPDTLVKTDASGENITEIENLRFSPKDMVVSPDGKKLAYFHDYTAGMLWLEDSNDSYQRKKGEQDIIFQSIHPIRQLSWHSSSNYILTLLQNDEITISEVDMRSKQNIVSWPVANINQFAYSPKNNTIWVLKKDGALLRHLEKE